MLDTKAKQAKAEPSLDQRIAEVLADDTADRDTLVALWQEACDAAVAAKAIIDAETPRILDLSNPDPSASDNAVRKARRTVERLTAATHQFAARVKKIDTAAYAVNWNAEADKVEAERDKLANELAKRYPAIVAELIELFTRIDANTAAISDLHGKAPSGKWGETPRRLLDAELTARNLDGYSAEQPPLRDKLQLPDFAHSRDIAFPPPAPLNPFIHVMVNAARVYETRVAGRYSDHWHEAKAIEDEQKRAEIAQREAELAAQEAEAKAAFERKVVEEDRARRTRVDREQSNI